MQWLTEAMDYLFDKVNKSEFTLGGNMFTARNVKRIPTDLRAESVQFKTLDSLVRFLAENPDDINYTRIIKVCSAGEVVVLSPLNGDRMRECIAQATAQVPEFSFGRWIGTEEFIIGTQSKFVPNDDLRLVQQFAGTVEDKTVQQYSDDGISQSATIKTGIAGKEKAIVPNPVKLRPYRTFIEVEQPESEFIFRMRNIGDGVCAALFEADGGTWEIEAMKRVTEYLENEMKSAGVENYTIIN